jgi:hypothetical protein
VVPQPPQFLLSNKVSTQFPPQHVEPLPQAVLSGTEVRSQVPLLQVAVEQAELVQGEPQAPQ